MVWSNPSMDRRKFLAAMAAGAVVTAEGLWIPGSKLISIPKRPKHAIFEYMRPEEMTRIIQLEPKVSITHVITSVNRSQIVAEESQPNPFNHSIMFYDSSGYFSVGDLVTIR